MYEGVDWPLAVYQAKEVGLIHTRKRRSVWDDWPGPSSEHLSYSEYSTDSTSATLQFAYKNRSPHTYTVPATIT